MKTIKGRYFDITEDLKETIDTRRFPRNWKPDPKGYFLIKVNREKKRIEVGYVTGKHRLTTKFTGNNAEELFYVILDKGLVSLLSHAAYLGKELAKAEIALKTNKKYHQDC
ncbi:MAG TPA: DUF4346 domain-containing protein [Candidatus Nanoarchaeia archaeon]|nr:DUF4346 domain-containing protein [Candidatus Nanoarchaeia archaeon]